MATFNQQGQTVHGSQQNAETITNAGQTFSFGTITAPADLPAFLSQLQAALTQATANGTLSPATGTAAHTVIVEATEQAQLPAPDKKSLLDHLITVKTLVESATAASTLVPAVIAAIDTVHKLF